MSTDTHTRETYKNLFILPKGMSLDALPPECYSCATLCGSIGLRAAPCKLRRDRGCLLLKTGVIRLEEAGGVVA